MTVPRAASPRRRGDRYNAALTECARSLLASRGDGRLERAMAALLDATEATYVFVERNVHDPELGFCSMTVAEVEESPTVGSPEDEAFWDLTPWDRMPISRSHLERGEPFTVIPSELTGPEYEHYAADPFPIKSELDIPIFVDGEWAGLIGFADAEVVRAWTDIDISLLTAAASMIGAFWERADARSELEQLIESKDDFVATVSHELRTPLTSIVGFAEELRLNFDDYSREEITDFIELIATEGSDMAHLVEDLLVVARMDAGRVTVSPAFIDLAEETGRVAAQIGTLEADAQLDTAKCWADERRVRQIIRNLLTNAVRYGGESIRLTTSVIGSQAVLEVADNGRGVAPPLRDRIFGRYQRGHVRDGQTQSIGLGLAVSRDLARLLGGDLTYDHSDGWSRFSLLLPIDADSAIERPPTDV